MKKLIPAFLLLLWCSHSNGADKPNILVIWGDDIGVHNISAYNHGIMGYDTPNIDRIASQGMLFTDAYAQQSCTAGRASFILGEHPFRTGLLTVGFPGSPHGIPDWAPTIADLLKELGYTTGQFGKNHLGDRDKHLPTAHGFDEFFGNLYHLNAEEEPETYHYPKDPEFRKKYGPRGVIHSYSDGRIEDTGPLTVKRMETVDEEFLVAGLDFMNRAVKADKPFFVWMSASRMHVWTHLKKESEGKTGVGLYADGMVEHDGHVGRMLDKLKELGIEENTIVIYSTDNGAEAFTWPDGGNTPFHGEKGTTWEGGFRVPMMVRWPNVVKPGSKSRDIISQEDWLPTLLAAAGEPQIKEKLKRGHKANGKEWRVHLDGYNFMPRFKGEADKGPRKEIFYFDPVGNLNAVRFADWKVHFSTIEGNITDSERVEKLWPLIVNLRADPYERIWEHATGHSRWAADNIWLFIPIQEQIAGFAATFADYPFQEGVSVGGEGLNYRTLRNKAILKELGDKGLLSRPGN